MLSWYTRGLYNRFDDFHRLCPLRAWRKIQIVRRMEKADRLAAIGGRVTGKRFDPSSDPVLARTRFSRRASSGVRESDPSTPATAGSTCRRRPTAAVTRSATMHDGIGVTRFWPRQAGAIVKTYGRCDACLRQKSAQHFQPGLRPCRRCHARGPTGEAGFSPCRLLADPVDDAQVFQQRLRVITCEQDRLVGFQRTARRHRSCRRRNRGGRESGKAGQFRCAVCVDDHKRRCRVFPGEREKSSGKLGGIFDGQGFIRAGVIERQVAPERHGCGTGFTGSRRTFGPCPQGCERCDCRSGNSR